jgi:hypothetical protein
MEDNAKLIESLFERATEYSNIGYELVKLKTIAKTSDLVSLFIPQAVISILISSLLFFFNLVIAFWLGEILGKVYYGFFVIASFYGILGIVLHFFLHNWLKRIVDIYIIKRVFN